MTETTCPECRLSFALPDAAVSVLKSNDSEFFCPNGHTMKFANPEVVRLRNEVENKDAEIQRLRIRLDGLLAQREHRDRQIISLRGVITRMKARKP